MNGFWASIGPTLKILLPALAGAVGTVLYVLYPETHVAFCGVR